MEVNTEAYNRSIGLVPMWVLFVNLLWIGIGAFELFFRDDHTAGLLAFLLGQLVVATAYLRVIAGKK